MVSLSDVVDEAMLLVQREVALHRIVATLEFPTAPLLVLGDRVQLQQVVVNLLVNAIQSMASVTDRRRELQIRLSEHEDGQVLLSVQDSGAGVDPDQAGKLFDPSFTTKPGGMGMGLAICRSIVEAHGGRIWASRLEGPGALFQLTLPKDPDSYS